MKNVKLVNKLVGDNYPCYYVAEIGGSFQNFKESKRLIDSAIDIGIDAVKFQTQEAETRVVFRTSTEHLLEYQWLLQLLHQ